MRLQTKTLIAFLVTGLACIAVTGYVVKRIAEASLLQREFEHLTAMREATANALQTYFGELRRELGALADCPSVVEGLIELPPALDRLPAEWGKPIVRADLVGPIAAPFAANYKPTGLPGVVPPDQLVAINEPGLLLQTLYIARNTKPAAREECVDAGDGSSYSRIHARLHPLYLAYFRHFQFSDIYLIGLDGRVVYSVAKNLGLGTNLLAGPLKDTALARAYRIAAELGDCDPCWFEPFSFYPPLGGKPAAFTACPVYRNGARVGVLAAQIRIEAIDEIASSGHRWREQGLGESGEVYLIGPDATMRCNARGLIEDKDEYLAHMGRAGADDRLLGRIRDLGTSILLQKIHSDAAEKSLAGESGVEVYTCYHGEKSVGSYAPFDISKNLRWGIVAKMHYDEVTAPIVQMRRTVLKLGLLSAVIIAVLAWLLSSYVVAPIRDLAVHARVLGKGDLGARIEVRTRDEIGELASEFNDMAAKLATTTVSRDYVDAIIDSMLNAVWVVQADAARPRDGAATRVVRANPALAALSGRQAGTLASTSLTSIVPTSDAAGRDWWAEATSGRSVGGVELDMPRPDGTTVPILLACSPLAVGKGDRAQWVCVAQDLTQQRLAQEAVREKDRLVQDMKIAQNIQRSLLPKDMPRIAGFAIAGWSRPADLAGGDYYDWIEMPDGRLLICVADVAGHGIGPAMLAAVCRAYLRAASTASTGELVEQLAARVNVLLSQDMSPGRFITAAVGVLDPATHELRLFSAGHAPMFFCRWSDGSVESWDSNDLPWGIGLLDVATEPRVVRFAAGDVLAITTDGFFEWFGPGGESFGVDRLAAAISANRHRPPEEMIRAMVDSVEGFVGSAAQQDDLTAVVIRREPSREG